MTDMPEEVIQERGRLVLHALGAAIDDDGNQLNACMDALAKQGWGALYGATLAFCDAVQKVFGSGPGPGEFVAPIAVQVGTNTVVSLDDIGLPVEVKTALRIWAAWTNGDREMADDLFYSAVRRGEGQATVTAALFLAATAIGPETERRAAGERN